MVHFQIAYGSSIGEGPNALENHQMAQRVLIRAMYGEFRNKLCSIKSNQLTSQPAIQIYKIPIR